MFLAATYINQVSQSAQSFNWHNPSWDLFIILFWAVVSLIYAFAAGRGRVINMLFSLYIARLLVTQAPWLTNAVSQKLPSQFNALQLLVSFLIIFILLFIVLGRYAFRTSADGRHFGSVPFTLFFSVLQVGLLISTIIGYLPAATVATFSPLIKLLFVNSPAPFVWLLLPLGFLVILGRSVADPTEI